MNIAIIGSEGTVGRTLVEHFRGKHKVLRVDPKIDTLTLEEASAVADVVWIATLPIEDVPSLLNRASAVMQPNAFLIHGTSIEKIGGGKSENWNRPFAHIHFHFKPEIPLRRTLLGQAITVSLDGPGSDKLYEWFMSEFEHHHPVIKILPAGSHDSLTAVSQLVHMITALLTNRVWKNRTVDEVMEALSIGGAPCRMLARAVLRTGSTAAVARDIILNHPSSSDIIGEMRAALSNLATEVEKHNGLSIADDLAYLRGMADPSWLKHEDVMTANLARLEADIGAANFRFKFGKDANRTGLLSRVLGEFDWRNVDKTTTIAQADADGGCTIIIGVREVTPEALEAVKVVRSWGVIEEV
jgi:hypothetical protein